MGLVSRGLVSEFAFNKVKKGYVRNEGFEEAIKQLNAWRTLFYAAGRYALMPVAACVSQCAKCLFPYQKVLNPTAFRSSIHAPILSNSLQIGKCWNVFVAELSHVYPYPCGATPSILLGFAHAWRQRQLSPKSLNVWSKWAFLITYTSFKIKKLANLPNQKVKNSTIVLQNTP